MDCGFVILPEENPVWDAWIVNHVLLLLVTMTEQQGTPDQLPAEKDQGGAGATYKVPVRPLQSNECLNANRHGNIIPWSDSPLL